MLINASEVFKPYTVAQENGLFSHTDHKGIKLVRGIRSAQTLGSFLWIELDERGGLLRVESFDGSTRNRGNWDVLLRRNERGELRVTGISDLGIEPGGKYTHFHRHHCTPESHLEDHLVVEYTVGEGGSLANLTGAELHRENPQLVGVFPLGSQRVKRYVLYTPEERGRFLTETGLPEKVDFIRTVRMVIEGKFIASDGTETELTPETFAQYPLLAPLPSEPVAGESAQ